jgi:hypothetical protein
VSTRDEGRRRQEGRYKDKYHDRSPPQDGKHNRVQSRN